MKGLTDDGKELSVKLFADAKTDDISAEVSVHRQRAGPRPRRTLRARQQDEPARGDRRRDQPFAARGNAVAVTEGMKKEYVAAIDLFLADLVKNRKAQEEQLLKQLVDAIGPTLKAGELRRRGGRSPARTRRAVTNSSCAGRDRREEDREVRSDISGVPRRCGGVHVRCRDDHGLQTAQDRDQAGRRPD